KASSRSPASPLAAVAVLVLAPIAVFAVEGEGYLLTACHGLAALAGQGVEVELGPRHRARHRRRASSSTWTPALCPPSSDWSGAPPRVARSRSMRDHARRKGAHEPTAMVFITTASSRA